MCYVRSTTPKGGLAAVPLDRQKRMGLQTTGHAGPLLQNTAEGGVGMKAMSGLPPPQTGVGKSLIDELFLDSFGLNADSSWLLSNADSGAADFSFVYESSSLLPGRQTLNPWEMGSIPSSRTIGNSAMHAALAASPVQPPPFQLPSSISPTAGNARPQPNLHIQSPPIFNQTSQYVPSHSAIPSNAFSGTFTPLSTPLCGPHQMKFIPKPTSTTTAPLVTVRKPTVFVQSPATDTFSNSSPSQSPQFEIVGGSAHNITKKRSVDEIDDHACKTAIRSTGRSKKSAKLGHLEAKCSNLERENETLQLRCAVLENGSKCFSQREQDLLNRIKSLETQLGESHRVMLQQLASSSNGSET
ncbi:hypothetical protein HDU78_008421 [Chytriomyces hyalinus]|nr:hypothetical protein HDU78_008421 [Chytriomyces hyalinus]